MRTVPFALLGLALAATAGDFSKTLSVGDDAPAWTDLSGTDGKKHSLTDLKGSNVVSWIHVLFLSHGQRLRAAHHRLHQKVLRSGRRGRLGGDQRQHHQG